MIALTGSMASIAVRIVWHASPTAPSRSPSAASRAACRRAACSTWPLTARWPATCLAAALVSFAIRLNPRHWRVSGPQHMQAVDHVVDTRRRPGRVLSNPALHEARHRPAQGNLIVPDIHRNGARVELRMPRQGPNHLLVQVGRALRPWPDIDPVVDIHHAGELMHALLCLGPQVRLIQRAGQRDDTKFGPHTDCTARYQRIPRQYLLGSLGQFLIRRPVHRQRLHYNVVTHAHDTPQVPDSAVR